MKVRTGTLLEIKHHTYGMFIGKAIKKFDLRNDAEYSIELAQEKPVVFSTGVFYRGDKIPCFRGRCEIRLLNS